MKKILSLALAAIMVVSVLPVAYAADVDYKTGTNVTVVGDGGEYFVTVPASLVPGDEGTVTAYGKWASNQTVKVWTDNTVEVTHQETGATTDVNITFAGIESLGSDVQDMNVTAPISIDKGDIRFGEWKGTIVYNVEFDDGEPEIFTFTIDGTEYQAEEGMTFGEWVISDYNTGKFEERDNKIGYHNGAPDYTNTYVTSASWGMVAPSVVITTEAYTLTVI